MGIRNNSYTSEQPSGSMRPFWLFAGGAVLGLVGLCGLVSLCAAGFFIWSSRQEARSTPIPTAAVVQPTTVQPTRTPIAAFASVTPLPGLNSTPAPPALTTPAFQTTLTSVTPDQAVRTYYDLVSQSRYDLTWAMLTDAFKQKFNCCAPNYNYGGYTSWWDSVNRVELGAVRTVSQGGDRAVVYAELYYVMNSGTRSGMDTDPYIHLVFDPTSGVWRFDDKRATA